jgi:hypothetical protein
LQPRFILKQKRIWVQIVYLGGDPRKQGGEQESEERRKKQLRVLHWADY